MPSKNKIQPQNIKQQSTPVYYITFEDYLKPNNFHKNPKSLLLVDKQQKCKPELRLKLLEHPVLVAGRKSKWKIFQEKFKKIAKATTSRAKRPQTVRSPNHKPKLKPKATNAGENNEDIKELAGKWQGCKKWFLGSLKLPTFLAFLKARNDDGLCKRKSGFEIYCEMASIHGFINFVGSTTGQRAFWCFVIFVAISMSGFILLLSHLMNKSTPTILYTQSTQHPTWYIPFPSVTICNLNLMSKSKVRSLAERFRKKNNFTADHLVNLFRLVLYATATIEASPEEWLQLGEVLERNNMTLYQLENRLKPSCETTILRCKWKGRYERCSNIFEIIKTSQGNCCSFNKLVLKSNANKRTDFITNENVEYTTSCGPQTGLTVLLNPELEDYHLAARKTPGMKVFIQDAYDFTPKYALHSVITPKSVNYLSITPQQTRASDYIASLKLHVRRCYLPQERKLFHFPTYSQPNCLAECRSARMYEKCHCTLNYWPKKMNWTICGWHDRECVSKHKDVYSSILKSYNADYRQNYYAESFICDCYPLCDFNMYAISEDSGKLNRQYALTDQRFFKDINITNHMVLHVYYGTLYAERLRLDVYENWLTFIGNFGGITGLHMGYSFVSGFEMIFFVFVRPACNWLTKKQIRYRVQRRQKKAKLEADKKRKMEEEKEKQERIEAFLKMRPHCPQY